MAAMRDDGFRTATKDTVTVWKNGIEITSWPNSGDDEVSVAYGSTADKLKALRATDPDREKTVVRDVDQEWIDETQPNPRIERDCRQTYALFREVCPGKTFVTATYEDGVALSKHMYGQDLKYATVNKKVGWLRAAINVALLPKHCSKYPKLKLNCFTNVVAYRDDATEKVALDDDDVRATFKHLGVLHPEAKASLRPLRHDRHATRRGTRDRFRTDALQRC